MNHGFLGAFCSFDSWQCTISDQWHIHTTEKNTSSSIHLSYFFLNFIDARWRYLHTIEQKDVSVWWRYIDSIDALHFIWTFFSCDRIELKIFNQRQMMFFVKEIKTRISRTRYALSVLSKTIQIIDYVTLTFFVHFHYRWQDTKHFLIYVFTLS